MKRITFTLLILSTLITQGFSQISNGDMENWVDSASSTWSTVPTGSGNKYYDLGPSATRTQNFFRSLNQINDTPTPVTGPLTCWRSSNAHSGSYAALLRSVTYATTFIPGFLGTGDVDIMQQTMHLGRQYTAMPDSFSAWYQYAPVGGDSAKFEVVLTHYDALGQISDTVAHGSAVIYSATTGWTNVKFPLIWDMAMAPDTAIIICATSAGYDMENLFGCVGEIGSQLLVDDIMLWSGHIGIEENQYAHPNVSVFPNPAMDYTTISVTEMDASSLTMMLYDMTGRLILSKPMNGNNMQVDLSTLPYGVYSIVLMDQTHPVHRSTLIKN